MARRGSYAIAVLRTEGAYLRRIAAPPATTTASRDRAILELWDLGWEADDIAVELRIDAHLVEQAIAIFDGGTA